MNFTSDTDGSINSAFNLDEQFGNISLHNEPTFDYTEVGGEDVLFVTQQELLSDENFCYPNPNPSQLDFINSGSSNLSGQYGGGAEFMSPDSSKSLDSVVVELGPEEVRWFYKCEADKRWVEFSGYDSLRIEFQYRQLFHEWHYYNATYSNQEECAYYEQASEVLEQSALANESTAGDMAPSPHKIVVRGGMYEVDLQTWKCDSIFWPGEECVITRGAWFYDGSWQPLEAEHCVTLENVHLELFYGHKLADYMGDGKTPKTVLHTESFPEFHVDWYSPLEVYLYSEATPSKLMRSFTQKLGFQKSTGYRLYRGFKQQATLTDRPVEITHLVFVIHGIGQKMDTGRIIRNTSTFRECVAWVKQKYFASSDHRAEFFPVEWRSSLKLDGDIVDAITPHKLLGIRQMLNSSAMDIMYYTSPLYGSEVQRGLSTELNRLYSMYTKRNPYFTANGGKVSVIAHSLGCVIVYDIVTGWRPDSWLNPTCASCSRSASSLQLNPVETPEADRNRLLFTIDNLFCLGSPLSVFLALRWKDPRSPGRHDNIVPTSLCRRLYNVFHPSDPVAYRMEPLVLRDYSRIAPLQIQAHNAAAKLSYCDLPIEPIAPEPPSATTTPKRKEPEPLEEIESPTSTPSKDRGWNLWGFMRAWKPQDGIGQAQMDMLTAGLPHRLDYVLREANIGSVYLSALTSHTAYWGNYDVAYFILTRLFPELEAQRSPGATGGTPPLQEPNMQ